MSIAALQDSVLMLAVLSLHVRADAVTREAPTAVAEDAAPAPAAESVCLPSCSITSPLPAAFRNILYRFSKTISRGSSPCKCVVRARARL